MHFILKPASFLTILILAACAASGLTVVPENTLQQETTTLKIGSPDGLIDFSLSDENGQLRYSVTRGAAEVIHSSRLGLRFIEQHGFDEKLRIVSSSQSSVDTSWEQPWGERQFIKDQHNELLVLIERTDRPQLMSMRVRVFNDGLGFRYEVPEQAGFKSVSINDELTEFNLDENATTWWIPAREWNRYEYLYEKSPLNKVKMVHTPVTLKLSDGTHVSLHEAALLDYSGMSLEKLRSGNLKANLAPRSDGVLVKTKAPFKTPWRTIQIASDAVGLMNSDLILNLNEPNQLGDVSWFTPGKYIGIWWAMHMRERTWGNDGIHGATTEETMRYMDFAAQHGFNGVLVEGWNLGWDGDWFHNGDVFNFTRSYPDFDIAAVAAYGKKVDVPLIGHHETSGNITNYENQMDAAFDLYEKSGVQVIKTGYVADAGDIKRIDANGIAQYEFHDGQHMVDHHIKVVKKAAQHKISINPHEPVKDTGLRRTYPNWVSREGARGMEFSAWGVPPNPPEHTTILPFTRLLSGPMDYTPGIFELRPSELPPVREDMPRNDVRSRVETTLAKQLALYLTIYSPIQMVADLPEHYAKHMNAFQFIKDVPTDWSESKALQGEIGDFLVIARKDRNSEDWYLGAITDEQARDFSIPLVFLEAGKQYTAQIYRDGPLANYDSNPYDIVIEERTLGSTDTLSLSLGNGGGAAIRFIKK
ncbi:MAG: glycoside hydrolase family 97 protein [Gammaproteobacteria bacterium]|nr:glycoside hydrolase family 97 protein [Gammaproteobacteria bacterium]